MPRSFCVGVLVATLTAALLIPTASIAQNWQDYSPSQRYEALRNYRRHQEQPRDAQRDVEQQYQRWQSMPEGERDKIRKNYERYRDLPPGERDQFDRKARTWRRGQGQQ